MSDVANPRRIGIVTPEQLRSLSGLEFLRRVVAGELPAPPHAWLRAMPQAQTLPIPLGRAFCLDLTPVSRACLTSRTFSFDFCRIPHVFVRYVGRVDMEVGSCIYVFFNPKDIHMKREQFLRRLRKYCRQTGRPAPVVKPARGKGSHVIVSIGPDWTTVQSGELDPFHVDRCCEQLRVDPRQL